jgi:hypothetical protein
VSGGISTDLTPPISTNYATGYGSAAVVSDVQFAHGTATEVGHGVISQGAVSTTGVHGVALGAEGSGLVLGSTGAELVLGSGGIGVGTPGVGLATPVVGVGTGVASGVLIGSGVGTGGVVDGGTTYSQNIQQVAIPVPHPVPVVVNRPVPVPVPVAQPVEVPSASPCQSCGS